MNRFNFKLAYKITLIKVQTKTESIRYNTNNSFGGINKFEDCNVEKKN